ncbi:hypothetical protein RI845_07605 [Thalassotalea nanhaiensis]|uniref:Lipoprotein n=1 Tax=Thalassotalea nanhaiensis TaxID=3065648 RepID=A0ABY9TMB0_9GAMM|nr:hypothetical protein RI845_07605 [Colwelliaceae bacterium SQ345]
MRVLLIVLSILSFNSFADESLSKSEIKQVEELLTEAVSKLIYLERDCDKPIDGEKVKEMAKLKAFSEGFHTIEGVSWETIKVEAHRQYGVLKTKAPVGELCDEYKADIKGNYKFLKDIDG